ncbi:MAG: alpha/beta hydrolase [Dehalococcoidia bacterium]
MAQADSAPREGSHWPRTIVKAIGATLAAVGALVVTAGYLWVRPLRLLLEEPVPPDVSVEDVYFPSRDGIRLHGLYMRGRPGFPALVICHGYFKSVAEPFEVACELNRLGYQVLLIDFRACGLSDGRFTTLGYKEVLDVLGAVDYLRARQGDSPIGVLGISMGAVAAVMAAAECPHIKALVVDSAYADLETAIGKKLADILHLPLLVPLGWAAIRVGERISGGNVGAVRAVDYAGRFAPRPLLFIYGELDDYLPSDHPQRLFEAASEPKELWLAPGSGHAMARLDHPQEYVQRVEAFFRRYLSLA